MDSRVLEHGPVFAARAVIALFEADPRRTPAGRAPGEEPSIPPGSPGPTDGERVRREALRAAERLRGLLAVAGPDTREEVTGALEPLRTTPLRRVVASYLLPDRTDWAAECCAEASRPGGCPVLDEMRLCVVDTPEHLAALGSRARLDPGRWTPQLLATVADRVGTALVPVLAGILTDTSVDARRVGTVLDLLGELPSRGAVDTLLDVAIGPRGVAARRTLMGMLSRHPVPVAAALAEAVAADTASERSAIAEGFLGCALRARPDLGERLVPRLSPAARAAVRHPTSFPRPGPEAPESAVPACLLEPPGNGGGREGGG
ncbi:hypothetical protein FNQ90_24260, partial [Streptomyces alkaliphilus]|nr:hypothetical protein [Streptomyces alkaliphilus]